MSRIAPNSNITPGPVKPSGPKKAVGKNINGVKKAIADSKQRSIESENPEELQDEDAKKLDEDAQIAQEEENREGKEVNDTKAKEKADIRKAIKKALEKKPGKTEKENKEKSDLEKNKLEKSVKDSSKEAKKLEGKEANNEWTSKTKAKENDSKLDTKLDSKSSNVESKEKVHKSLISDVKAKEKELSGDQKNSGTENKNSDSVEAKTSGNKAGKDLTDTDVKRNPDRGKVKEDSKITEDGKAKTTEDSKTTKEPGGRGGTVDPKDIDTNSNRTQILRDPKKLGDELASNQENILKNNPHLGKPSKDGSSPGAAQQAIGGSNGSGSGKGSGDGGTGSGGLNNITGSNNFISGSNNNVTGNNNHDTGNGRSGSTGDGLNNSTNLHSDKGFGENHFNSDSIKQPDIDSTIGIPEERAQLGEQVEDKNPYG